MNQIKPHSKLTSLPTHAPAWNVGYGRRGRISGPDLLSHFDRLTSIAGFNPSSLGSAAHPAIHISAGIRHWRSAARSIFSTGSDLTAAHLPGQRWGPGCGIKPLAGWQFTVRLGGDGRAGLRTERRVNAFVHPAKC